MNQWLNPVVDTYLKYFGMSQSPIVWEVGSRDGHDGFELMKRISAGWRAEQKANVVCLEPNPEQVDIIKQNYPMATVYELAAGEKPRKAKFKVYHGNEGDVGSSSLYMNWKKGSGLRSHIIQVQIVRLDSLIGDELIDIMKIDVEGYSKQVLLGLGRKLTQVRVYHIETEHDSKSDVWVKQYMAKYGYKLTDETEQYGGMPDLTFVNPSL